MPFDPLPGAVARKDRLTPGLFNALVARYLDLRSMFLREHDSLGAHDAWEAPRAVFYLSWDGANYAVLDPAGHGITVAPGPVISLPDNRHFSQNGLVAVRAQALSGGGGGWSTNPWLVNYRIRGERLIELLPVSLNPADNTLGYADTLIAVAIHVARGRQPGVVPTHPTPIASRQTLAALTNDGWNLLVRRIEELKLRLLTQHDAAGEHVYWEIPRGYCAVAWNGAAYSFASQTGLSGVSRIGAGHVRLSHKFAEANILPFVTPKPQGGGEGDIVLGGVDSNTITSAVYLFGALLTPGVLDLYLWRYAPGSNSWALTDMDFGVSFHVGNVSGQWDTYTMA